MYQLDDKYSSRFRRNNAMYLYWEIIQDKFKDNCKFMKIFDFCINMFFNKNMKERPYVGVWFGMFIINYDNINWDEEVLFEKNNVDLQYYFENRKDIEIDNFVVNDYHVNKKFGLDLLAPHYWLHTIGSTLRY